MADESDIPHIIKHKSKAIDAKAVLEDIVVDRMCL